MSLARHYLNVSRARICHVSWGDPIRQHLRRARAPAPRHDPAPATSCWRLTQPARRSSTEFLKGPSTWAAYAHVLGTQPFQNFLCSAAQKLAPHGVGPMQCRRYGYACTHFAGRDKGFTSSSSFSPMGAAWQYPRETSIVVQPSPNQAIEHGGPPRSQDHHKQNKTSP